MWISICVLVAVVFLFGAAFGVCIERDRFVRFPTIADTLPRATATWSERRRLRQNRADLRAALGRRS